MAGAPPAFDLDLPDVGAKYRMVGLLGRGGMGAVYEAEHVALRRLVAIKRLAPGFGASERAVERLRREAESASRIGHPNIVQIVDFDVAPDGLPFVVMERLEGEDLRHRLDARGRLAPAEAVEVVTAVCAALSAAHAHGILHRDVKPENVFLASTSGGETVKLLDFGLAQMAEGRQLTVDGEFVGTPAYLAPEQVSGGRATERTDVHAVSALAYECLTGVAPFLADGLAPTLTRILEHDPPPPTLAGAPKQAELLDRVVLKGLEKDPRDRWPTTEAFSSALRAALAGEKISGIPVVRLRRLARSRGVRAAAATVVVAALATSGFLLRGSTGDGQDLRPVVVAVPAVVDRGCGAAQARRLRHALRTTLGRIDGLAPTAGGKGKRPRYRLQARCTRSGDSLVVQSALVEPSSGRTRSTSHVRGPDARAVAARVVLESAVAADWAAPPEIRTAARAAVPVEVDRMVERVRERGDGLSEILAGEIIVRQAVLLAPDYAEAHRALAKNLLEKALLAERGQLDALGEAVREVERATALDPASEQSHLIAATIQFVLGRDLASLREIAWVERHAKDDPTRAALARLTARIAWRKGQAEATKRAVARCLTLAPRDAECLDLELRERSIASGRSAFESALADPEVAEHLVLFGRIRARALLGRRTEAALDFRGGVRGAGTIDRIDRPYFEGMIARARDDRALAVRHLGELERLARSPDLPPTTALAACWQVAELAAFVGDGERVVTWAREGLARGFLNDEYWSAFYLFDEARRDGRLPAIAEEARRRGDALWAQARQEGLVE